MLARARASRDRDERLRLYREFERLWIGERAAIVPLSYARQLLLRRPDVHGLRLNPMGVFHLEQVVVDAAGGAGLVADRERQRGARAVAVDVGRLDLEVVTVVRERRAVPVVRQDVAVEPRLVRMVLARLGPVDGVEASGLRKRAGRRPARSGRTQRPAQKIR